MKKQTIASEARNAIGISIAVALLIPFAAGSASADDATEDVAKRFSFSGARELQKESDPSAAAKSGQDINVAPTNQRDLEWVIQRLKDQKNSNGAANGASQTAGKPMTLKEMMDAVPIMQNYVDQKSGSQSDAAAGSTVPGDPAMPDIPTPAQIQGMPSMPAMKADPAMQEMPLMKADPAMQVLPGGTPELNGLGGPPAQTN